MDHEQNNKISCAVGIIQQSMKEVVQAISSSDFYKFDDIKSLGHPALKGFFILIKKLAISEHADSDTHYYALSVRTPYLIVPIDILDVINTPKGIDYRFEGIQVPALILPTEVVIDGQGAELLIRMIINNNRPLMDAILKLDLGDASGLKKSGK